MQKRPLFSTNWAESRPWNWPAASRRSTTTQAAPKTKTVTYDVAEQLSTPAEMAAYLEAWLTDAPDDATGIARALGDIARAKGMRPGLIPAPN